MLENDLDTAEGNAADGSDKIKELEAQVEELIRENKQLQHRNTCLEGEFGGCKFSGLKIFCHTIRFISLCVAFYLHDGYCGVCVLILLWVCV